MKTGIAINDILSEVSHYRVVGINADDSIRVVHTESGDVVNNRQIKSLELDLSISTPLNI